jgi:pyruvate,orthophosphate dikinase
MGVAVEKGRSTRKKLKVGICGEHGGEPSSVEFCNTLGFNYVSCSPFRVPIARLAAAQAVIKQEGVKPEKKHKKDKDSKKSKDAKEDKKAKSTKKAKKSDKKSDKKKKK